jgi:hypothetical protein
MPFLIWALAMAEVNKDSEKARFSQEFRDSNKKGQPDRHALMILLRWG